MQRFLPDAYVFAIILTFITIFASLLFTDFSGREIALSWGNGFWNLNKFAMEMVLILVSGFTLAKTKFISGIIDKIANMSQGQIKPVLLATFVSSLACLFNWGFGLVVAALISLEIAKRNKHLNPGLLIAASYSGFLLWHGGLSGSITRECEPIFILF